MNPEPPIFLTKQPSVHPSAFIAPSANLLGDVTIGKDASVWYHAVLRGDINCITLGERSNIQDGSVVHLSRQYGCHVGRDTTIGHKAILHACKIGDEVLVGMGAIILDGTEIGDRCIIGAGALITGNKVIPPGSLVLGSPAKVVKQLTPQEQDGIKVWANYYVELLPFYQQGMGALWAPPPAPTTP